MKPTTQFQHDRWQHESPDPRPADSILCTLRAPIHSTARAHLIQYDTVRTSPMVGMDYHSDCLKIVVDFATTRSLSTSMDMPNTYDQSEDRFEWRTFEFMEYALVPREFNQGIARVDLYILMDEDDLDDIDEVRYIADFLTNELIPQWNGFTVQWVSEPEWMGPDVEIVHTHHAS